MPQSGRELAGLVEALYLRLFVIALAGMQIVCAMVIVAALPRTSHADLPRTAALAIALAVLATLVLARRGPCYHALRRRPLLSLTGPVLAMSALVIDGVSHSPLSYAATVSLAVPGFVCGRRWSLTGAALITIGALGGAWVTVGVSALNSVGQGAAGYFGWALVQAGLADCFARLLLQLPTIDRTSDAATALRVPNLAGDPAPPVADASARDQPDPGRAALPATLAAPRLTARQLQVVALLADGFRAEAIGVELGIKTATVYRLTERAKRRAGVGSRAELVAFVLREGLLQPRAAGARPDG
jgi:DNA-binding CsgD family transcriptional regulator